MEVARSCMNIGCGTAVKADEWRKGWGLRSGGFAILCEACGMAYEQQIFCDMFHSKETGWRECSSCHKRLHCGCIASASLFELADAGGIQCVGCKDNLNISSTSLDILHSTPAKNALDEEANATKGNSAVNTITLGEGKAMLLDENPEINNQGSTNGLPELVKKEQMISGMGTLGNTNFPKLSQVPYGPLNLSHDESKDKFVDKAIQDSLLPGCFTLVSQSVMEGYNARSSQDVESPSRTVHETREQSKAQAVVQQWQRSCCLLPKPSRITLFEAAKDALPNMRVARPPAEGRGRPQLLPRYWPRITDQELRQISGDSNSTIVPLFEKVLSASDAGRIGRLVLPKACAEAYFPPISQPEGLPIKIQDAKGKDWVFQFRFWPNNNSRMYVLEGVTPCIQSMQLQAGDTVTFSRIDPEGKLVMGFRKATNTVPLQDSQISALANGSFGSENFLSGVLDNQPIVSSYPGIFQSIKGSTIHQLNSSSEFDGGMYWQKMEGQGHKSIEGLQLQQFSGSEKRSQNIGPKRKRLHIDNEDAVELKMTWDEAQDLLRPPQSIQPSIVMVEDFEFEEYEEPPVFGKRTVITSRISGEFDQWAQCDSCSKWRRLPVDVILSSSRWTCAENFWDTKSSSCTESEEINPVELNNLLQQNADIRKQKLAAFRVSVSPEEEMPGINAPATAASLGDDASPSTSSAAITTKQPRPRPDCTSLGDDASPSTSSVAITTKHPRHRPGCTCIVCIQPPSGKGPKHKPTCTCNVCSTVKRRFKTLMMRKKKRQSESEDVEVHKRVAWDKQDAGEDGSQKGALLDFHHDAETGNGAILADVVKGKIDLNFNPKRGEEGSDLSHANLASLHVPNFSLEVYIKQNELSGFIYDEQASSSPPAIPEVLGELERNAPDECFVVLASQEKDSGVDEEHNVSDLASNDGL